MKQQKNNILLSRIKHITLGLCTLAVLFVFVQDSVYGWNKKTSIEKIAKAKALLNSLSDNEGLAPFIPFKEYSEAFINAIIAQNELNKSNFTLAYYYASIAEIQTETLKVIAEKNSYKHKKIILERDYFKKTAQNKKCKEQTKTQNKDTTVSVKINVKVLLESNLKKKGDIFRIEFLDRYILTRWKRYPSEKGKRELSKIIDILNAFPKSKIIIVGHSSYFDLYHYSKRKAYVITKYLIDNGIAKNRITTYGLGNSEVMKTPWGYRRLNRIEILIKGIKL